MSDFLEEDTRSLVIIDPEYGFSKEIEEELTNRDSFDAASDYDRGMRDAYRWVRNKLRSLPEIPVIRKGEIIYERMG